MILGLTGGIASGKSTVSGIFREAGLAVYDADAIAREVSETPAVIEELTATFGAGILSPAGDLDRAALKTLVFSDKARLARLNAVIHPRVIARFEAIKAAASPEDWTVFDIPLLFEAGLERLCDKVLVVWSGKETQMARLMARDGIDAGLAEAIIDAQAPLSEKLARADLAVNNDGTPEALRTKILDLLRALKGGNP
ncbi:MAG: dephospho-CoA kinase [Fusobacteriaceae bacterium]|nr:dephospho-CoA kinase [Fusobacteriaceae bacterium]